MASTSWQLDHRVWNRFVNASGKDVCTCNICNDGRTWDANRRDHLQRHEQSTKHQENLQHALDPPQAPVLPPGIGIERGLVDNATHHLVYSLAHPEGPLASDSPPPPSPPPAPLDPFWGLSTNPRNLEVPRTDEEENAMRATRRLESFLNDDLLFSDDDDAMSDSPDSNSGDDDSDAGGSVEEPAAKRSRAQNRLGSSADWFPYPDRITMQTIDENLQKLYGIDTKCYEGSLGHRYYVNDIGQIIAQEMANPEVVNHLHFFPEDSGVRLTEARQGSRWLHELPAELTTPCVRRGSQDFYIHEPVLLRDHRAAVPVRWFERDGQMFGKCWGMQSVMTDRGEVWRVIESLSDVPLSDMLMDFEDFKRAVNQYPELYRMPHPSRIHEIYNPLRPTQHDPQLPNINPRPWILTNTETGNHWRSIANGRRVVAFPIWLYCDDTSGNLSKKWNAHNSFLFTAAGLPRREAQREYNVHFLCTSNIAPPLEMFEGVLDQIESYQKTGIEAWDAKAGEPVIVFPVVLALLGDNPMQSELCSHIGLRGRLFCRHCWAERINNVKKKAKGDSDDFDSEDESGGEDSDGTDRGDAGSDTSAASRTSQGRGGAAQRAAAQSIDKIKDRLRKYFKGTEPRKRSDTIVKLKEYWDAAAEYGNKASIAASQTQSGIKDKFQQFFLNQLSDSTRGKRKKETAQPLLDAKRATMPSDFRKTINPLWRMKGINGHTDTPVEILHVILLGFVKYMWRDVIKNQLKDKDLKKDELATRLSSLDVSGLGISPLAGKTLVKYAGSLVGRDFRVIAQVAPFVLYDIVKPECYRTWLALAKLIPLVWQPEIDDVNDYTVRLTRAIDQFLLRAGDWTPAWFNKPKFHLLVHLPDHIRRFGPAILFATEAFESFNAVIRAKSVHSNRQAPSRDIARAFAKGNRVRHFLSGGLFQVSAPLDVLVDGARPPFSLDRRHWTSVGSKVRGMVSSKSTVTSYLGMQTVERTHAASFQKDRDRVLHYYETQAARHLPAPSQGPGQNDRFAMCLSFSLVNGDVCRLGDYVIVSNDSGDRLLIGKVHKILHTTSFTSDLDWILIQVAAVDQSHHGAYIMPYLECVDRWSLVQRKQIRCTVNTQHPCADNGCRLDGIEFLRQERHITTQTRASVQHKAPYHRRVLNTAQMRDARWVQVFAIDPPPLDFEATVTSCAEALIVQQTAPGRGAAASQRAPPPLPSALTPATVAPLATGTTPPTLPTVPSAHALRPNPMRSHAPSPAIPPGRPRPRRVQDLSGPGV
ncbi:hypothetical protein DFP72DRAFT_1065314 [Ephemerocybe angulata]|uniref:Uncharacterized protein n=1 Tax=Ephemerocybe angulata TaxID=980116 RepID=A0A8H6I536_9AGAR|nr:hypothetical protein DFP72DRAFT_1065314 [Tulosesus angulatus]